MDDRNHGELTAIDVFSNLFSSGQSSGTIFYLGIFSYEIEPPREFTGFLHEESVVMCAVFGAQLPSFQLPGAVIVDTMSHVRRPPYNGASLGCPT